MKKVDYIRTLLSVTQQEMAMLLHISRSQWSMYELGERDLPVAARQLLAELLMHLKVNKNIDKSLPMPSDRQLQLQQQKLAHLLRENEYQQLLLARKIAAYEKKQASRINRLQIVDFVDTRHAKKGNNESVLHQNLADKVIREQVEEDYVVVMEHELKQELLHLEKSLLESKLAKIKAGS